MEDTCNSSTCAAQASPLAADRNSIKEKGRKLKYSTLDTGNDTCDFNRLCNLLPAVITYSHGIFS